ncbi:hypothetical protein RUR49_23290 [Pseudoxanthobacter sp. M-2]|uniref:hypothetical protein n=1 Tax=Pseudoxanthobacter sp. M-2 TaxID=3078754 RepID=UPI0038FCB056
MIFAVPALRAREIVMAGNTNPKSPTPERIPNADAAAEHDVWFRAEVEMALAEADDPQTEWVSQDEVERGWGSQRAALAKAPPARS